MKWTTEKIQEFAVKTMDTAKELLVSDGELMPVMFILSEHSEDIIVGLSFENTEEKKALYRQLEKLIATHKPTAVVMLNESWMKSIEPTDAATLARIEEGGVKAEPDRLEGIALAVSPIDGADTMMVQMFHHEGDKIVFDGDVQTDTSSVENRLLRSIWKDRPVLTATVN
jgi:hypothetical protein